MLGERLGVELSELANRLVEGGPKPGNRPDFNKSPDTTEGMIPRVVQNVFKQMKHAPDTVEYIVRCSYVEIYLEKIQDLLQPWREHLRLGISDEGEAGIVGVSELCCVDPTDVYALLARGNAYRTKSATDRNADSSRSHAVFSFRLEQIDRATGKLKSSRLQMVDLAGSEVGKPKSTAGRAQDSPGAVEGKMINASLASLNNVIRLVLASQGKGKGAYNPRAVTNASKLAKLLRPGFGENTFTTIICTGSPSSYNIHETINTIKFGQQARQVTNHPLAHEAFTANICRSRMAESENRNQNLTTLVKMLARECRSLKVNGKQILSDTSQIWDAVNKIADPVEGVEAEIAISVSVKRAGVEDIQEPRTSTLVELEKTAESNKLAKEKAESTFRDLRSDITGLRSQNELLTKERGKLERELLVSKDEIRTLSTRKSEIEHRLRTSEFREREAILFLRQFRTFYFRLLKNKAAHGSGSTKDITEAVSKKILGVSDLADLLDVDKVMMQSGIIEKEDVGKDTNSQDYKPSKDAVSRSAEEAEKAESKEFESIKSVLQNDSEPPEKGRVSITNSKNPVEFTFGQLTSYRQKLLESPAGRLAMQKELELEKDLRELAKKCVTLQNSVIAEKAMVEALSARQGAMGKMKTAQELNTLKQELERKTNDLHAIVWKMNELHLVNKTIDTKVENREQHVTHLEEHLSSMQTKNRRLAIEKQETEKRLREENQALKNELDGMAVKIWQLGEPSVSNPQPWRSIVPYNGEPIDLTRTDEERRRMSLGDLRDEEIEGLVRVVKV
jgi:kinesin family protein 5